ncbi:hypothetical protein EGR_06530 [Echinococcus granulosus]|uniref:Uncharacterized protein n=1 Tax=Echinococcus granulosus TaxID=6210 RepID=W6UKN3_ECHGR|nr:hypothetical protein EGR_06530 [Echinococcus granulosus]EUB58647.1 hypothetical protein EGR_06530 [Echinococcus granulosus]
MEPDFIQRLEHENPYLMQYVSGRRCKCVFHSNAFQKLSLCPVQWERHSMQSSIYIMETINGMASGKLQVTPAKLLPRPVLAIEKVIYRFPFFNFKKDKSYRCVLTPLAQQFLLTRLFKSTSIDSGPNTAKMKANYTKAENYKSKVRPSKLTWPS